MATHVDDRHNGKTKVDYSKPIDVFEWEEPDKEQTWDGCILSLEDAIILRDSLDQAITEEKKRLERLT